MFSECFCENFITILLQLQDIFQETKLILADCLFCLASQHPLEKDDTLRLISFLKKSSKINANGKLDLVTLCLIMALLYCFDVSILDDDNNSGMCFNIIVLCKDKNLGLYFNVSELDDDNNLGMK